MTEVLKKLNLGDAGDQLIKYMGQNFRYKGRKEKEDEQVKKLRNCKDVFHSLFSSAVFDTEEIDHILGGG